MTPDSRQVRFRVSRTTFPIGTSAFGNTADSSRPTIMRIRSARVVPAIGRVPTSAPSRSAVTRSAISGNSSSRCDTYTTPAPRAFRPRTTRNRFSTSRPESDAVGSSITTTRASAPTALAISTNCCSGMLSERTSAPGSIFAPIRESNSAARARRSPHRTRRHAP